MYGIAEFLWSAVLGERSDAWRDSAFGDNDTAH